MAAGSGALELRAMATRRRDVLFLEEEGRRGRSKAAAAATEPAWKAAPPARVSLCALAALATGRGSRGGGGVAPRRREK